MLYRVLLLAVCLLMALSMSASAENLTLGFDSLPSQQGWTYQTYTNAIPETSAFSLANGRLVQNTYGMGLADGRIAEYRRSVAPASQGAFNFDISAKCTAFESWDSVSKGGMCFSFTTQLAHFGLSLMPNGVVVGLSNDAADRKEILGMDNTGFHNYTFSGTYGVGSSFSLYRDGLFVASGTGFSPETVIWTPTLTIGDQNGGANANGEISNFSFTYDAVPEPSSILCLAGGLGMIGILRRKRG